MILGESKGKGDGERCRIMAVIEETQKKDGDKRLVCRNCARPDAKNIHYTDAFTQK